MTRRGIVAAAGAVALGCAEVASGAGGPILSLAGTIPMPGVRGRVDHMTLSDGGTRLFVAAIASNSVEVVNLEDGKLTDAITGLNEPQDVQALPENRVLITNGGSSSGAIYDAHTLSLLDNLKLREDADNIEFDAEAGRVYIGCGGWRDGAITVIDPRNGSVIANLGVPGHPERFQLETQGSRIFVNVPTAREVTVLDRKEGRAVAHWPIGEARGNYPMALDETTARLFIGCRDPACLLVLDTHDGKVVTKLDCVGDADDIYYDAPARRLYVTGGGGAIDVFRQDEPDQYTPVESVKTRAGARTSLFDADHRLLYVAVPATGSEVAEIRGYRVAPAE